jgi:predicted AlkP superfamily phosphohydrolase/phosphomutase
LVLKGGVTTGADYLKDVDWSKTKAFALGLSGIYLNVKGRERQGIVEEKEIAALKAQISQGLEALRDPQDGTVCVSKMYDTAKEYKGLYASEAPDLIVGYAPGYRVSWDSVTGIVEPEVFSDNVKAWSGDHHIDPALVPGVLFSNLPLKAQTPHIADLAPTVLDVFGVAKPAYMEGKVII